MAKGLFVLNPFPPLIPDFRLSYYKLPKSDDPILRVYLSSVFLQTQLVGAAMKKLIQAKNRTWLLNKKNQPERWTRTTRFARRPECNAEKLMSNEVMDR
jgi:hypothetical protein